MSQNCILQVLKGINLNLGFGFNVNQVNSISAMANLHYTFEHLVFLIIVFTRLLPNSSSFSFSSSLSFFYILLLLTIFEIRHVLFPLSSFSSLFLSKFSSQDRFFLSYSLLFSPLLPFFFPFLLSSSLLSFLSSALFFFFGKA